MPLTQLERLELQRILGPVLDQRAVENQNGGIDSLISGLLDPTVDSRVFVKTQLQNARAALVTEQGSLVANAQARNQQINAELAILDGLLAKFP